MKDPDQRPQADTQKRFEKIVTRLLHTPPQTRDERAKIPKRKPNRTGAKRASAGKP